MKNVLLFIILALFTSTAFAVEPDWALFDVRGGEFHEGLSYANGGYIGTNGKYIIEPQFKNGWPFMHGFAKVKDKEGYENLIDRNGKFVLPQGPFVITNLREGTNLYSIKNKDTGLSALIKGRQLLTGYEYDVISAMNFPFIELTGKNKAGEVTKDIFNTVTMEFLKGYSVLTYGNLGYVVWNGDKFNLYSFDGEPLDKEKFRISTDGHEVFYDKDADRCGIRNISDGQILTSSRYKPSSKPAYYQLWVNDVVSLLDPDSGNSVILNSKGKEIVRLSSDWYLMIKQDFIEAMYIANPSDYSKYKYFDFEGKEIKAMSGNSWSDKIAPGVYASSKSIYLAGSGKRIDDASSRGLSENMLRYFSRTQDKYYYYNLMTGKRIGPFESANNFSESVAVVRNSNKTFLVDTNGKEYYYPDNVVIDGETFSEGVIRAEYKDTYQSGYVYNPTGHQGYSYAPQGDILNTYYYDKLFAEADRLADMGNYARAMDKYYECMMYDPKNFRAFTLYAWCLYKLSYYDEALTAVEVAIEMYPPNDFAKELKEAIMNSIESKKNREDNMAESLEENSSYSVWDALGNFANSLMVIVGQSQSYSQQDFYQPAGHYSSQIGSDYDSSNFESEYRRWESIAERHYNSLTNSGYSATSKNGKKSGSSGSGKLSSANYVQQKRLFREAQREMSKIRNKAQSAGIHINKSKWENATVSY